jgi:hypothetical protein
VNHSPETDYYCRGEWSAGAVCYLNTALGCRKDHEAAAMYIVSDIPKEL